MANNDRRTRAWLARLLRASRITITWSAEGKPTVRPASKERKMSRAAHRQIAVEQALRESPHQEEIAAGADHRAKQKD
jgi:hypothetical protein